jgi:hypothetical protein
VSKNDITGDNIKSKLPSKAYEENFESVFGKKLIKKGKEEALNNAKENKKLNFKESTDD